MTLKEQQDVQTLLIRLQATQGHIQQHLAPSKTIEEANTRFSEWKDQVKKNYKQLAIELHPDKTNSDPEKTHLFKLLTKLYQDIEKLTLRIQPPQPPPTIIIHFGGSFSSTTGSTTTGFSYGRYYKL